MPTIIHRLPLSDRASSLAVHGRTVSLNPFQIALSVSIGPRTETELHPHTPRFPALLDSGFNSTFVLSEQYLNQWAGLRREHLVRVDEMTVLGHRVPVF